MGERLDNWAGWANQLTCMCDSYLRRDLQNDFVPVIGVAFQGDTPNRTMAAILSIEEVPGSQVVFSRDRHVGEVGFAHACNDAVYGNFPEIKLPPQKPTATRILKTAIEAANEMLKK